MKIPHKFNPFGISKTSSPIPDISDGCGFFASLSSQTTTAETGQTYTNANSVNYVTEDGYNCAYFINDKSPYSYIQGKSFTGFPYGNTSLSLSVHIKCTNQKDWQCIMMYGSSYNSNPHRIGFRILKNANDPSSQIVVNLNGDRYTNISILPNVWYSIAMTYDNTSSTMKVYVNGVNLYEENSISINPNAPTNWGIGANSTQSYQHNFQGYIMGCRVYNKVISNDVINYLYQHKI